MRYWFLGCCVLSCLDGLYGQSLAIKLGNTKNSVDFLPLPVVFYEPYTSFGFGFVVGVNFHLKDTSTSTSSSQMYAAYTLRNQFLSKLSHYIFLPKQSWLLTGNIFYRDFAEDIYRRTGFALPDAANVTYQSVGIKENILKQVGSFWFVGLSYFYAKYNNVSLATEDIDDAFLAYHLPRNFVHSSIGIATIYDSRDNINSTYSGVYFSFSIQKDFLFLGSSQELIDVLFELRTYHSLKKKANPPVLAIRLYTHYMSGDQIPYLSLPRLGESNISRGIKEGRYRSEWLSSLESSIRLALFPKSKHWIFRGLRANFFGGIHAMNNQPADFTSFSFFSTIGVGLRYQVNPDSRQTLRGSIALGSHNNWGAYANIGEAF